MRTIVVTAALALAAASSSAALAQQHHDRSGAPGQGQNQGQNQGSGPPASSPAAPAAAPAAAPSRPAAPEARPVPAVPGEPEIFLYTGPNYTGSANRLTGAYPNVSIGGVNSVKLNGQTWRICSGANYTGSCVNISQSNPNFAAYFGPPAIHSLKRIDEPRAPTPPAGSGNGANGNGGYGGNGAGGGNGQGGQGRPPYGQGPGGAGGGSASMGRTTRYVCSGDERLTAVFDDRTGSVRVSTDREGPFTLRQSVSASGFRYQGANRTFSGRGDQATYAVGGNLVLRCQAR